MEPTFTPLAATLGGILVGLGATLGLVYHGRVAGISGILGAFVTDPRQSLDWQAPFLSGLLVGGMLLLAFLPGAIDPSSDRTVGMLLVAGLLVGFGTAMSSGCTSGHGVCGIGRFSKRSIAATLTFMATGALVVGVLGHVVPGVAR